MSSGSKNRWLIALLLVLPLGLSGCGSKEERLAKHLEKAKTYYEQGDYDKARVESKNALQLDPKNAETYYLSGQVDEQQQLWRKAYANYLKAVELDPGFLPAKAKLARIYLISGDIKKAEQAVDEILTLKSDDAAGRTLKAALLMRKNDVQGAINEASAVIAADPAQADAVSLLAVIYRKQGDDAKAQMVLEKGMKASPKDVSLRLSSAEIAIKQKDMAKAEKYYREIVALEPQSLSSHVRLATFYANTNQLDKAEKVLRDAIEASPEDEQRQLLLVEFLASRRGAGVAEKELLSMIQAAPKTKSYKLRFGLARMYEATGKPDKAIGVYQGIADLDDAGPDGIKASAQNARLQIQNGNTPQAEKLIAEILEINPRDNDALLLRGKIELARGDARNAIIDFRSVLKAQPDSVQVISLLAKAHLRNNEPQLARDTYDQAVSLYPDASAIRFARADFLGSVGNYDAAIKDVNTVLEKDPENVSAMQAKAELLAAKQDWPAAESYMSKVKAATPTQPTGYYRLGLIYQAQKKFDLAAVEFESALHQAPQFSEALSALVNILMAQGKVDAAIARIQLALQNAPANFTAYKLLGEVYADQKKYAEAETAFRKAIQIAPKNPSAYINLAKLGLVRKDVNSSIQVLQQGLTALPDTPQLQATLAEVYQTAGNNDRAIAIYEKMLKSAPDSEVVANNLASLLTDAKGDKASLEKAKTLALRFADSENLVFQDTLGWIYVKTGEYDRAQPLLENVVEKAPKIAIFQYHLGMLFYNKGDMESAKSHLQQAVSAQNNFPGKDAAREILQKI